MGEFSIIRCLGLSPRAYGIFKAVEGSEMYLLPGDGYKCRPRVHVFSPVDSRVTAPVIRAYPMILAVLGNGANAKVVVPVVERVSVDMVPTASQRSPKNHGVHRSCLVSTTIWAGEIRSRIKRLSARIPCRVPVETRQFLVSMCRYLCNLPLREWDNAVGLIQRLNNRLAASATFGHDSTSNGIAAVQPHNYCSTFYFWMARAARSTA